jgi:hypothetical protein
MHKPHRPGSCSTHCLYLGKPYPNKSGVPVDKVTHGFHVPSISSPTTQTQKMSPLQAIISLEDTERALVHATLSNGSIQLSTQTLTPIPKGKIRPAVARVEDHRSRLKLAMTRARPLATTTILSSPMTKSGLETVIAHTILLQESLSPRTCQSFGTSILLIR